MRIAAEEDEVCSGSPNWKSSRMALAEAAGLAADPQGDGDVGIHALFAVGAIERRIELGGGQLEAGRSGPEGEDALYRAFAVGAGAQDRGSVVVLKGTGQDFTGACAIAVDQDVHGHSPLRKSAGCERLGLSVGPPASGYDQPLVDEPLGDFDGDVEKAARVTSEIKHQDPHALPRQGVQGAVDLFSRRFLKTGELEITDAFGRAHEFDSNDALDIDVATNELVASGFAVTALCCDLDSGPFLAAEGGWQLHRGSSP